MSRSPLEIPPWRECPFLPGRRYRVRQSFKALRDTFAADEILIFESDAWSRYDGITGYFFRSSKDGAARIWDLDDEAGALAWKDFFEALPDKLANS